MTLTIELSPELEARFKARADQAGMDQETYLRSLIEADAPVTPAKPILSGADMVAFWEANGLLTGYGDPSVDAPDLARQIRERFSIRESNS